MSWYATGLDDRNHYFHFCSSVRGGNASLKKICTNCAKPYFPVHSLTSRIVEEETGRVLALLGTREPDRDLSDRIQEAVAEAFTRRTTGGVWIVNEYNHSHNRYHSIVAAELFGFEEREVVATFWNPALAVIRYSDWGLPVPAPDGVLLSEYDFRCEQFEAAPRNHLTVQVLARPVKLS
jgi:hypothetical protein